MRHDKFCAHLQYSVRKALGTEPTDNWFTHVNKPAYEQEDVTVLWNQALHTDREVTPNRPDVIFKNQKVKMCIQMDVAIPADRNVCR